MAYSMNRFVFIWAKFLFEQKYVQLSGEGLLLLYEDEYLEVLRTDMEIL